MNRRAFLFSSAIAAAVCDAIPESAKRIEAASTTSFTPPLTADALELLIYEEIKRTQCTCDWGIRVGPFQTGHLIELHFIKPDGLTGELRFAKDIKIEHLKPRQVDVLLKQIVKRLREESIQPLPGQKRPNFPPAFYRNRPIYRLISS